MAKQLRSDNFNPKGQKPDDKKIMADLDMMAKDLITMLRKTLLNPSGRFRFRGGAGSLINSLDYKIDKSGKMTLLGNEYINTILYGRRPNSGILTEPGIQKDIEKWLVKYKFRLPFKWERSSKQGKYQFSRLAWNIIKKIDRKGIRGRDFLYPTINAWERKMEKQIGKSMDYYVDNYIVEGFVK